MSTAALTHKVTRDSSINSNVRRDSTDGGPPSKAPGGPRLKFGDVLVSRPSARADLYETSVVPAVARITDNSYEDGMNRGRALARELAVDAWYTCDHIHFGRLAHRRL